MAVLSKAGLPYFSYWSQNLSCIKQRKRFRIKSTIVLLENAYVQLLMPSCSLIGFSAIGKVLRFPSGVLFLVCNGEECLRSSPDTFLLAWRVQRKSKCSYNPRPLKTCHRHVFLTRTFESGILLFGLHNWLAEVPFGVLPLINGGECWTRTSDLLRVKQAL